MSKNAVIFDLDGVIVSTDEYHYQAWQRMTDEIVEKRTSVIIDGFAIHFQSSY